MIADYFSKNGAGGAIAKSGHDWEKFLAEAEKRGFRLEREEEVTEKVLPTLDLANHWLEEFGRPAWDLLRDSADSRYPLTYRLLRKLFASRLRKLEESLQLIDREAFARHKRYSFLLFAVPAAPPSG